MVKDTYKLKYDSTLALAILELLNTPPLLETLQKHFTLETQDFYNALSDLDAENEGNHVDAVLVVVQDFHRNIGSAVKDLGAEDRAIIQKFIDSSLIDLYELLFNVKKYNVTLQSALDAYTLNHTSFLIAALESFIDEKSPKTHYLSASPSKPNTDFYRTSKKSNPHARSELDLADGLKEAMTLLRDQIGSSETMPKGLIITLMHHLCDAMANCQDKQLLSLISLEITELRISYPELAQAGEELQKAIANYQP